MVFNSDAVVPDTAGTIIMIKFYFYTTFFIVLVIGLKFFSMRNTRVVSRHLDDIFQTIIGRMRNTDIDNRVIRNIMYTLL